MVVVWARKWGEGIWLEVNSVVCLAEYLHNVPCVHAKGNGACVGHSVQEIIKPSLVRLYVYFLQWGSLWRG